VLSVLQVRCQAGGLPVRAVLQQLLASGSGAPAIMRQLYAGVVSASLASVAVGELALVLAFSFVSCWCNAALDGGALLSAGNAQCTQHRECSIACVGRTLHSHNLRPQPGRLIIF
jgi:hypothetical protein